jgi:UDP-N-acetylmuramoyl-tripeptide--D-alanyl-D-alanine ligase
MKNPKIILKDLFDLIGAEIYNPDSFQNLHSVSIDSRNIGSNCLFVAIKGERLDGHNFIKDALQNGAKALLINKKELGRMDEVTVPFVTVDDTTKALGELASIWRSKLKTKIIGITGSAGKTSTKEMLAVILNEKFNVNKTQSNNNNHIGVPLTLFSTNDKHNVAVLELGTNHFGEIKYTSDIARPDYGLITNIGSSHLEYLKNKKGVLKEKSSLLDSTDLNKGVVFINNDDPLLKGITKYYKKTVTYSLKGEADIKGKISGYTPDGKAIVEITFKTKKLKIDLPLYGEQNVMNLIASVAVAFTIGLSREEILNGIKKLKAVEKRLNVRRINNIILIDDTYNANPESMRYAVQLLNKISVYDRKIAILGDMFELGEDAHALHSALATVIVKNKISEVYTTGKLMKNLYTELDGTNTIKKHFPDKNKLAAFINSINLSDSVILVKGSRGMQMEEFVNVIEGKK